MDSIKVRFHSLFPAKAESYFLSVLKKKYIVDLVDNNYDFFFAAETIYWNEVAMREFLDSEDSSIKIMFCGEAVYPDLNLVDYAVVMQKNNLSIDDRIIYLPFLLLNNYVENGKLLPLLDEIKNNIDPEKILREKTAFCNFIYANSNADSHRDELFHGLSVYKEVSSLGKHLKNTNIEDTRNEKNWKQLSVDLKKKFKFSISAENACFRGYTSEKIITSMLALTIPIYWGNPVVGEEYNKRSFIDAMDFDMAKDLVDYVREIDQNDKMWCDIMEQKWRTDEQLSGYYKDVAYFEQKYLELFNPSKVCIRYRPTGTFSESVYLPFMTNANNRIKGDLVHRIKGKMRKVRLF